MVADMVADMVEDMTIANNSSELYKKWLRTWLQMLRTLQLLIIIYKFAIYG